jgi:NDP-sugar pyrophosphorylase family protein
MIVAAGLGTRLLPLTKELPKPGLPVGNQPLAWFAIDHLRRCGIREFVVNTHHLGAELRDALEATRPQDTTLRFVHEPEILGTGGGLRNAWQPIDGEDFVVMNGKLLFAPDLSRALEAHRATNAIATMILRPLPDHEKFGAVEIDGDNRVRRLLGQPEHVDATLRRMMFTGVHILSARAHRDLPENGCVIRDAYRHWIDRGETVSAVVDDSPWRDLGVTVKHYLEGNLSLLRDPWPGLPEPDARGLCHPSAEIASRAVVSRSVIGPHAYVAPNVRVEGSVVWPHARVTSDLINSVLTTRNIRVSA